MGGSPTLADASWTIRGMGYGFILGAAASEGSTVPFRMLFFIGMLIVLAGQFVAYRATLRGGAFQG